MQNINNIKVNDEIRWMGGKLFDHQMSGIIVERVRAKSRPVRQSYSKSNTDGKLTKREVSFVVRYCRKLYWVDVNQIKLALKRKKAEPKAKPLATPVKINAIGDKTKVATKLLPVKAGLVQSGTKTVAINPVAARPVVPAQKPPVQPKINPPPLTPTKSAKQERRDIQVRSLFVINRLDSPFVPRPGIPMPYPFRQDFSCLNKHLPANIRR